MSTESVLDFAEVASKDSIQLALVRLFMLQFVADKAKKSSVQEGSEWSHFYTHLQNEWRKMDRLYLDKAQTLAEMIFEIERCL